MRMQMLSSDAEEFLGLIRARLAEIEANQTQSPLDGQPPSLEALSTLLAFLSLHPEIEAPLWLTMRRWLQKNLP